MQLLEAVVISLINTLIVIGIHITRIRLQGKVRIYGPIAYKLDESNTLKEIPSNSIPIEKIKALQEKILSEIKPNRPSILNKTTIILFAAIIFIIQLIIFLFM